MPGTAVSPAGRDLPGALVSPATARARDLPEPRKRNIPAIAASTRALLGPLLLLTPAPPSPTPRDPRWT